MIKTVFVISDLHLGGNPDFQICSSRGQKRLAEFILWASAQQSTNRDVHVVLAGDIVDFLAEEPFATFTQTDALACTKLKQIFHHTAEVWDAFAEYMRSGAALTLLLGNHDIELSLNGPRRLLLERLGQGRVDFIYDNQALVIGPMLIEHGNRYDSWNIVPHDTLRQVRSALSRGESPPELPEIPGSHMVIDVMNRIKKKYHFIDLLKPETSAAIPLLAVLEPTLLNNLYQVAELYRRSLKIRYHDNWQPKDKGAISADTGMGQMSAALPVKDNLGALLAESQALVGGSEQGAISAFGNMKAFVDLWKACFNQEDKKKQIARLYRALSTFAKEQHLAFDVNNEESTYLNPAKSIAERGFEVVVFGHTHLVKRVPINNGKATYFNSGTWADIMRLPDSLLLEDEIQAQADLSIFANELLINNIYHWREQVPTFVRMDIGQDSSYEANIFLFHSRSSIEQVPDGTLRRFNK
jgi:UDP-2,3-diacylglucosamine pyrophosphatase LpxH